MNYNKYECAKIHNERVKILVIEEDNNKNIKDKLKLKSKILKRFESKLNFNDRISQYQLMIEIKILPKPLFCPLNSDQESIILSAMISVPRNIGVALGQAQGVHSRSGSL